MTYTRPIDEMISNLGSWQILFFVLRSAVMFASLFMMWRGFTWLWELRPVSKKLTKKVEAEVVEIEEEHRSATTNVYCTPHFVWFEDGKRQEFAPKKPLCPCRLRAEDEVFLFLDESQNGRYRFKRKKLSLTKALILFISGAVLFFLSVFV